MDRLNRREILSLLASGRINSEEAYQRLRTTELFAPQETESLPATDEDHSVSLLQHIERFLIRIFAEEIKLDDKRIDVRVPFEQYGIDSLMVTRLNKMLENQFGELPKTLFFEYSNISRLAEYLVNNHGSACSQWFYSCEECIPNTSSTLSVSDSAQSLEDMQTERETAHHVSAKLEERSGEIAIVGVDGRYPMADNLLEFWDNLTNGRNCVEEVPPERWEIERYFDPNKETKGKSYIRHGGFIREPESFDSIFFNISSREADLMDPQERIFLETAWNTLEDAGYTKQSLQKDIVGVFVGVMYGQYQLYGMEQAERGFQLPNSVFASIANRVSYFFDFHGPSMAIDTMCSSSLTALHLACDSIRKGECTVALAGGVNLTLHPNKYILLSQGRFASSEGKCRSFGEQGDGFVPGEGVGAVLLKPLEQAVADGDQIYAVIKATVINHGGRTNGYSVPSLNAQAELIKHAIQKADIPVDSISYIEAHGTGTSLGDPIEIAALRKAFQETGGGTACRIGSVKSNIGHTESAAGIAGVTKVLLQMKYKKMIPSLHAEVVNPNIDFHGSGLQVQTKFENWNRGDYPRRAGISAFGAGGSNAHVILEEYSPPHSPEQYKNEGEAQLFVISAKSEKALRAYIKIFISFLQRQDCPSLHRLAYVLQTGRQAMEHRAAFIASGKDMLVSQMQSFVTGEQVKDVYAGSVTTYAADSREADTKAALAQQRVVQAIEQRNYSLIASAWIEGKEIPWGKLYEDSGRIVKVSLPTYPFERKRHWIKRGKGTEQLIEKASEAESVPALAPIYCVPKWELIYLNEAFDREARGKTILCIFPSGQENWAEAIAQQYLRHNEVLRIRLGVLDARVSQREWEISLASTDSFKEVLKSIKCPDIVFHFGGVSGEDDAVLDNARLAEAQQLGLLSVFRFVQSASELRWSNAPLQLCIVTAGAQSLRPEDPIYPVHAGLFGFSRSLAKEFGQWTIRAVDLPFQALSDSELAKVSHWVELVAGLSNHADCGEIAVRGGRCYAKKLTPAPDQMSNQQHAPMFRQNGVYLIVGGAGGIGFELSKHLAREYRANIAWIGRSPLDARITRQIEAIRDQGGQALYFQADISNYSEMNRALHATKERFGRINGAIHSAIVLKDRLIEFMDETEMQAVLAPKMSGAVTLYHVLRNEDLDLVLFFSSAQSFSGNAGQSNYAAACTFKDAFAHYWRQRGSTPVKIINWGYWGSVGIVATPDYNRKLAEAGLYSLSPREGMEAITYICGNNRADQMMVIKAESSLLQEMGVRIDDKLPSLDLEYTRHIRKGTDQLNRLSAFVLAEAFQTMCVFSGGKGQYTKKQLKDKLCIVPGYDRLFDELIDILLEHDIIHGNGYMYDWNESALVSNELRNLDRSILQFIENYPELEDYIRLVSVCAKHYAGILSGKTPATDILFPGGSLDRIKGIYRGNQAADYFNDLVLNRVIAWIEARKDSLPPGKQLKILEIGAGTGGTSASILKGLSLYKEMIRYTYTDISIAFVNHGKKEFGADYPFVNFKILNIEEDPVKQGYQLEDYDLILATNVLHATKNMTVTLRHVQQLLSEQGVLIVNEGTERQNFLTLTFGLLDGWWLYEDENIRLKSSPLLSADMWCSLLNHLEFADVAVLGTNNSEQRGTGQHVIVAKSFLRKHQEPIIESPVTQNLDMQPESLKHAKDEINLVSGAECMEAAIMDSLSEVLEVERERFDIDAPFTDFGVDSILAVEIIELINARLQMSLRSTDLFNYATIRQLTEYLCKQCEDYRLFEEAAHGRPSQPEAMLIEDVAQAGKRMDIAVIGMSAQMPGARNIREFWRNISSGMSSVKEIDRWSMDSFYDPDPEAVGKSYSKHAGLMEDVDKFDPAFFNISPAEAEFMDPRQRLFLQEAWKAVEDAGYSMKKMEGTKCGVYVGAGSGDYHKLMEGYPECQDSHAFMGNSDAILASRISYYLNLRGPSMAIDTACSSSLSAVHLACESIRNGSCEMAIAGGVEVLATPQFHVLASKTGMISADGSCMTFDRRANGFVPGEGVGAMLLKPLAAALEDGDHVYAVIAGSAMNQDGKTNGITAPSAPSQAALVCEVYDTYGIDPESIGYVEAHGTGTRLGDPIEIDALSDAYNRYTSKTSFCAIGSVKTNIGHTLAAAGIAGLIKIILCIEQKHLVPSLNYKEANEFIHFEDSAFYVNTELCPWKVSEGSPRRAAVSAFGFSGTNVHMVVEEPPRIAKRPQKPVGPQLIFMSAKTDAALRQKAADLQVWMEREGHHYDLDDIGFTLNTGRDHFPIRCCMLIQDRAGLIDNLEKVIRGENSQHIYRLNPAERKVKMEPSTIREGERFLKVLTRSTDPSSRYEILSTLAEMYVHGCDLHWEELYPGERPLKISLPAYPFAKERYWFDPNAHHAAPSMKSAESLHPLIDRNMSSLYEHKYEKTFTGHEFYLADHVVFGHNILPGVAYLEMMRAAAELASDQRILQLKSAVWASPIQIALSQARSVYVGLREGVVGLLDCEVYSVRKDGSRDMHFQGKSSIDKSGSVVQRELSIDLGAIRQRCTMNYFTGRELYSMISAKGLMLGSRFHAIQQVWGSPVEALAKLQLPDELLQQFDQYVLHPILMDAALLSIAGIKTEEGSNQLYIPFSLGTLEIIRPMSTSCYVHVSLADRSSEIDFHATKFNIVIADEQGRVAIQFRDFLGRIVDKQRMQLQTEDMRDKELLNVFHKIYSGELDVHAVESITGVSKV